MPLASLRPRNPLPSVEFRHTFGDELHFDRIQARVDAYNEANPGTEVVNVYRGVSDETLQEQFGKGFALGQDR